jgi:hypothetical protein
VARRAGDRRLELAGEVGEARVADVAAHDLLDRGRAVDDLVGRDAGDRGPEHHARGVAARLVGREADGLQPVPDRGHVLDPDPVQLDVLPVGDVGGVTGVGLRDVGDRAQLLGAEQAAVAAHAQHEVLVVELLRLERAGPAAVDPRSALGVEAPPAHPAAQVRRVDGGEPAGGVHGLDAVPDVEAVVGGLERLVGVERSGAAQRPLAVVAAVSGVGLLANGSRDLRAPGRPRGGPDQYAADGPLSSIRALASRA